MSPKLSISLIILSILIVGSVALVNSRQSTPEAVDPAATEATETTEGAAMEQKTPTETEEETVMEQKAPEDTVEEDAVSQTEQTITVTTTIPAIEPTEPLTQTHTVTYTEAGFAPKNIEINLGDTVKFVNESGPKMWVASAQHPSHKNYPEKSLNDCLGSSFDQCEGSVIGTSWEYTFNHAGSWGYHNHRRASDWGIIIVTE